MKISDFLDKDNNNLDLVRILLACLVIIGHANVLNGPSDYWIDPIEHFFKFTYSGALAVKLFFFISGLVVTNSYLAKNSAPYFIISRFFRLIPALFFLLMVTVFIFGPILTNLKTEEYFSNLNYFGYIWHNIIFYTDYLLPGIFNNNVYPNVVNGSLWSLRFEVGCYLMLLILFLILGKNKKDYLNILILIVMIDTLLPSRFILNFLGDNSEKYLLPLSFAYGAFFAINSHRVKINFNVVFLSFLMFYIFKDTNFAEIIFILSFCNAIVYLSSIKYMLKLKPRYDISYGIYLWGFLIQQVIFHFFGQIYVGFHCLIALVFSFLLALITYIYIEKPFIRLGKVFYKFYIENIHMLNCKINSKALMMNIVFRNSKFK